MLIYNKLKMLIITFLCLGAMWFMLPTAHADTLITDVTATASSSFGQFTPDRAAAATSNTEISKRWYCSNTGDKWIQLDLKKSYYITKYHVDHLGYLGWASSCNTKTFALQKSDNGIDWVNVDNVSNVSNTTDKSVTPFNARYVRLNISQGNQSNNNWASIANFQVYYSIETLPSELDIATSAVSITNDTTNVGKIKVAYNGTTYDNIDASNTNITVVGNTTTNKILIDTASDKIVKIILRDINIDLSATSDACAFDVPLAGLSKVDLTLVGTNVLKSGANMPGLHVPYNATLIITPQSNGSLTATGGFNGSGIGGKRFNWGGYITINGGTVTALGGPHGAGIGGGNGGQGGNITINNGTVNAIANGSYDGAGIGGGASGGAGGNITINGGIVTATGGAYGAGIGGGGAWYTPATAGAGGNILITGGNVTAKSGKYAAGIGGGVGAGTGTNYANSGAGGNISITGGTVTAVGGNFAAGIGGTSSNGTGTAGASGTIIISNVAIITSATSSIIKPVIDADGSSSISSNILVANFTNNVLANTKTEVKSSTNASLSPTVEYTSPTSYKSIAFTVPNAGSYTLYKGNGKQQYTNVTTDTIFTVGQGINVFSTVESVPTYYLTVNLSGGNGGTIDGTYVSGTSVNIDAGTKVGYIFSNWVSSNGGSFGNVNSASTTFTMPVNATTITALWTQKTAVSIITNQQSFNYDGGAKDFLISGVPNIGYAVLYFVNGTWTSTAPTNSGSYNVKITRAEDATYASYNTEISNGLVIQKATPSITLNPTASTITYGDLLSTSTLTGGTASVVGSFAWTNVDKVPTVTNSGYNVIFTPTDTVNYNTVTIDNIVITVNKRTLTVTNPTITASKPYDGNATAQVTLGSIINKVGNDVITVSLASASYDNASVGNNKTITVKYEISGANAGNYNVPSNFVVTNGEITNLSSGTPTFNNKTETYTGSLIANEVTNTVTGVASIAYNYVGTGYNSANAPTNAGTYDVTATFTMQAGYSQIVPITKTLTIQKATPSITLNPTASTITYGDLLSTSTLTGGTASVVGSFAWTNVDKVPTVTNSGYNVIFTPTDTLNYNTVTIDNIFITLSKRTLTVTNPTITASKPYDGNATAQVTLGSIINKVGNDVIIVSLASASYDNASVGNNKTITVTYEISGANAGNYNVPSNFVVTNGEITNLSSGTPTFNNKTETYTGSLIANEVTNAVTGVASIAYNYVGTGYNSANAPTNAGTYDVTATFTMQAGYGQIVPITKTLTIQKATPSITLNPTASTITYGDLLSASTLTGGTASVVGSFGWTNGNDVPTVTNSGYSVIFTPTDTVNYNTVTVNNIVITVNKANSTITNISNLSKAYNGSAILAPTYTKTGSTGAVTIEYKVSTANDSAYGTSAPKNAGNYMVRISLATDSNYNSETATTNFSIQKATPTNRPTVGKINVTTIGGNNGKITGVDSTMEYKVENGTYSNIELTEVVILAEGKYYVRYKENDNYLASQDTEVVITEPEIIATVPGDVPSGTVVEAITPSADTISVEITKKDTPNEIIQIKGINIIPLNLDIKVLVNGTAQATLTNVIKIIIPIPTEAKGRPITVYRMHGGTTSILPDGLQNAVDGEYVSILADFIELYVKNFSDYAIGYTMPSGGGGSYVASPSTSAGTTTLKQTSLTFKPSQANSEIYYTLDGTTPTKNSAKYEYPIILKKDTTIKYFEVGTKTSIVVSKDIKVAVNTAEINDNADEAKYIRPNSDEEFAPDMEATRYMVLESLNNLLSFDKKGELDTEFPDVKDDMTETVAYFQSANIIDGFEDGTFKGEQGLTRAEFVKIMTIILKLDVKDGKSIFNDMKDHWSEKYVAEFTKLGYLKGYEDGNFNPDNKMTRAEFVVIVNRIIKTKATSVPPVFTDLSPSHWAYSDIMTVYKK